MDIDERAIVAANNNADLCEAMYSSQGLSFERLPFAFVGKDDPPPYYANLTTLSPEHESEIAGQIESTAERFGERIAVKDSSCQLDADHKRFDVIFDASWIWREGGTRVEPTDWQPVESETELLLWERAWKQAGSPTKHRMFNQAMLNRPDIEFLGLKDHGDSVAGGSYVAGCIANRSAGCIGVSNVFSQSPTSNHFGHATAAVASLNPLIPIVGYESGEVLGSAISAGFRAVGELRVLLADFR